MINWSVVAVHVHPHVNSHITEFDHCNLTIAPQHQVYGQNTCMHIIMV
jgi:hypothetical protein